eukprot:scaffold613_cov243-Pinguiococcus_pyrenoidosus.AAC.8
MRFFFCPGLDAWLEDGASSRSCVTFSIRPGSAMPSLGLMLCFCMMTSVAKSLGLGSPSSVGESLHAQRLPSCETISSVRPSDPQQMSVMGLLKARTIVHTGFG